MRRETLAVTAEAHGAPLALRGPRGRAVHVTGVGGGWSLRLLRGWVTVAEIQRGDVMGAIVAVNGWLLYGLVPKEEER